MTAGTVRILLLSWSKLLSTLRDAVNEDRAIASDVDQLAGLVERIEADGFIPLVRGDLEDLDVPRRILRLAYLVNDIVDAAVAEGVLSVRGLKPTHYIYGTGRYAAFRWMGGWIGLNHQMWSKRGRTPIWLTFHSDDWGRAERLQESLHTWLNDDPPRAYVDDGKIQIPVLLAVGVEKERVVADAARQIRELSQVLMLSGLPPVGGETLTDT